MEFEKQHIEEITVSFHSFYVEGFNLFALGEDQLPHLICACPNKGFTRAICTFVETAKRAQILRALKAYITSHCYLSPMILAEGRLGRAATVINDAVHVDGQEPEYNEPELLLGTAEYENFVSQFLLFPEKDGGE